MRPLAVLFLQAGMVILLVALLARLVPIPNQADAVGDDLAIFASTTLVVLTFGYLRLRREGR